MSSGWARIAETESRTSQHRSSGHSGIVYALPDKSIGDIICGALLIAEIPFAGEDRADDPLAGPPAEIADDIRELEVHPNRRHGVSEAAREERPSVRSLSIGGENLNKSNAYELFSLGPRLFRLPALLASFCPQGPPTRLDGAKRLL
jgi:hypothetical protein